MAGRASGRDGGTLAEWLEAEGLAAGGDGAGALADAPRIRALLIAAAREERSVSYSELLGQLGLRFTRPKMRALCRTLDLIDRDAAIAGEPALAVLVVRETDRLPGQGWWIGREGVTSVDPGARALVEELQCRAFAFHREG